MQTTFIHPELARYIARYNHESEVPFGAHIGEVRAVTCPFEALDLLRSDENSELTREHICFKSGDDALAHFIYINTNAMTVYFVENEVARKIIPLLREDGGGINEMGIIEHWTI